MSIKYISILLFISLLFIGQAAAETKTIKLQTAGTENLADSYVDKFYPNTNYGSSSCLGLLEYTNYYMRTYIRFNLSSIPVGATINNASLFLYMSSAGSLTTTAMAYHQVNDTWTELGIKWNNQPCPGTGCNSTAESTNTTLNTIGWKAWFVTNMIVNATTNGKTNVSIFLKTAENVVNLNSYYLYSKEYPTDTTLRPYLNITYTEAEAGTTPNITSWGNNYTNNNTLSFTLPQNTNVTFNATANQTLTTCSWVGATQINCSASTFAYKLFDTTGVKYVNLSGSNTNGSTLNSVNWTIVVETAAEDTSFTVTIPVGYSYMTFEPPNSTAKYFYPNGQNSTVPFFEITNDGNIAQSFRMYLNATITNIDLYSDLDITHTSGTKVINETTDNVIVSSLASLGSQNIWMFSNFSHAIPQNTNRTLTVNSSS